MTRTWPPGHPKSPSSPAYERIVNGETKSPAEQMDVRTETRRNPEMEKYVQIRPVIMQDYPDAHNVFLKVDNQSFCVSTYGCETKDEAEWMRDMLCIALARVVAEAALPPSNPPGAEPTWREKIKEPDERALPTYGQIPWDQLGRDVLDAQTARRDDFPFMKDTYPGHQMVPGINFNSLARIVDKYRYYGLPCLAANPPGDVREKVIEALKPFANLANGYDDEIDSDDRPVGPVALKFCRDARRALASCAQDCESPGEVG